MTDRVKRTQAIVPGLWTVLDDPDEWGHARPLVEVLHHNRRNIDITYRRPYREVDSVLESIVRDLAATDPVTDIGLLPLHRLPR